MASSGERRTPEGYFGSATIKGTCNSRGCGGQAVAVIPVRSREEGTAFLWLCEHHLENAREVVAGAFTSSGGTSPDPYEIVHVCQAAEGDAPCGAHATHVLMVGDHVSDRPVLRAMFVCERHVPEAEAHVAGA